MRRSIVCLCALSLLGACDDLEGLGVFRLDDADGDESTWSIPDRENVGAGPARLAAVASNLTGVRYALGQQRSAYLFEGNLATGISLGDMVTLPLYDPGSPDIVPSDGVDWMQVSTAAEYNSFRVYDSGVCSLLLQWEQELLPGLVPAFANELVSSVDEVLAQCNKPSEERFTRIASGWVTPTLRAKAGGGAGALGLDDDVIRFYGFYRAPTVEGVCAPVHLDVFFDVGFRYDPSGNIIGFVDEASVRAEVTGFCIIESLIEDKVVQKIKDRVPAALEAALAAGTLLDPNVFGIPDSDVPSCTSDATCTTAYPWGSGHRCKRDGVDECWIQLDVDRVNVRPEGVELVLFDDETHPQRGLLSDETPAGEILEAAACGPDRLLGLFPLDPVEGQMSAVSVPVGPNADTICDGG